MGGKVEEFKKNGINGSMAMTLTVVELEKDLSMSSIQAKKFQAAILVMKEDTGGSNKNAALTDSYKRAGIPEDDDEYTASTYPSDKDPTQVGDEVKKGPK